MSNTSHSFPAFSFSKILWWTPNLCCSSITTKPILTKDTFSEIDNSDLWLSNTQLITVWPSDPDLKLVGEDIYFGENPMDTLKPINEDEIPDYYKLN